MEVVEFSIVHRYTNGTRWWLPNTLQVNRLGSGWSGISQPTSGVHCPHCRRAAKSAKDFPTLEASAPDGNTWRFPKSWGYPKLSSQSLVMILGETNGFWASIFRKPLDKQTCERTKCLLAICELICWTSDKTPLMISGSLLIWLVVWTPLKNISQLGWLLFPIYGKIKMFQTTNQNISYPYFVAEHVLFPLFVLQENSINHGQA